MRGTAIRRCLTRAGTWALALVLVVAAIGLVALLSAPAAEAAASCSFNANTAKVTVQLPSDLDHGNLSVGGGGEIEMGGAKCGTATVTNTDTIKVIGAAGSDQLLSINVSGGPFAPGKTDEPGSSDEIEFNVDLGGDLSDGVSVFGALSGNVIRAGAKGLNLNAGEADGIDLDAALVGVQYLYLYGEDGVDSLSGAGGRGT